MPLRYKPPPADGRWRGASDDVLGLKSSLAWLSDKLEERAARRRARMGRSATAYSRVGLADDYEDDEEVGIASGATAKLGGHRGAYGSNEGAINRDTFRTDNTETPNVISI